MSFPFGFKLWGILLILAIFCMRSFPIVEPDPGHTKLRLSREGLEAIERITNPIAAVAVCLTETLKLALSVLDFACCLCGLV